MKFSDRVAVSFGSLMPVVYRKHIKTQLAYAGVRHGREDVLLGGAHILALSCIAISVIVPLAINGRIGTLQVAAGIGGAVLIHIIFYLMVYFRALDRAKRAEQVLPDVLHLIASNLRAGMTPYNALKAGQRKEFGPLGEEIEHAAKRAQGTESFGVILLRIREHINSGVLERTLRLFTTSLRSGGHSATLLEELANDITETRQLRNDFVSATKTYSMFIFFTVVIGAPVLLTISIQFVRMITAISSKQQLGGSNALGLSFFSGQLPVSVDFLFWLSIVMLLGTSTLASVLMGVIKEGRLGEGLRFAPFLMGASVTVFLISQQIITGLF